MYPEVKKPLFEKVGLEDLGSVAHKLVPLLDGYKICLVRGEMGAGKTTLIKKICEALGVEDTMSSPTFSIVNEYNTTKNEVIFHFDLYRIQTEVEARDIGAEEYLYSGNKCFIEWPEKIESLLPLSYAEIFISVEDNTHRTLAILFHG
jgi:tRNA threonylcarbamoyladenosine biosynthesis protein TsaE